MKHQELKDERKRRGLTQAEMASFLDTKLSTYRKWEQDVNPVPEWVGRILAPDAGPAKLATDFDTMTILDKAAREQGITLEEIMGKALKEYAKRLSAFLLLVFCGWQIGSGAGVTDDNQARVIARGRRKDGLELVGEC